MRLMWINWVSFVPVCSLLAAAVQPVQAASSQRPVVPLSKQPIAFVNVTVISMLSDKVQPNQTVIIRDGLIAKIGSSDQVSIPTDAKRIDASGKYLIPGLADMHVHLLDTSDFSLLLANGVTTVCNMSGIPAHLEWREKLRVGEMLGPMLFTTGPMTERKTEGFLNTAYGVKTVKDAELIVSESKEEGYDFVKVHGELSKKLFDAVMAAAKRHDIRVVGHGGEAYGIEHALQAGQASIEHAEEYVYCHFRRNLDESGIKAIAQKTKQSGAVVTPTLVAYDSIVRTVANIRGLLARPELRYYAKWKQESWGPDTNRYLKAFSPADKDRLARSLQFQKKLVLALHRAGVPLMTGTDYGGPGFLLPGFDVHAELAHLVDAGVPALAALRASTINPARHLRNNAGAVDVGRLADLVLLDANPLDDIANTKRIAGVMVRGRWLSMKELDGLVERQLARNEADAQLLTILNRDGVEAAKSLLQERSITSPDGYVTNEAFLLTRVLRFSQAGDIANATAVLKIMTETFPESYLGFDLLGKVYARSGKKVLARKQLRKSVNLNPHNTAAKRLLKQLE